MKPETFEALMRELTVPGCEVVVECVGAQNHGFSYAGVVVEVRPQSDSERARIKVRGGMEHSWEEHTFFYYPKDGAWRFVFPNPMTRKPVFIPRDYYLIKVVDPEKIRPLEASRQYPLSLA